MSLETPQDDEHDRVFPRLGDEPPPSKGLSGAIFPILTVVAGFSLVALLIWLSGVHIGRNGSRFEARWGAPPSCFDNPMSLSCQQVDPAVAALYRDINACHQPRRLVCIVPVGGTTPEMIEGLTGRLMDYAPIIPVAVAPPLRLSDQQLNRDRNQYNAEAVIALATEAYGARFQDDGGLLLALTPVDIYLPARDQWRFAFGTLGPSEHNRLLSLGIVSTLRMSLVESWRPLKLPLGADLDIVVWPNSGRIESRAYKMLLKYIGLGYYDLSLSPDPHSVLYNNILSVDDLDRMDDQLPIAFFP